MKKSQIGLLLAAAGLISGCNSSQISEILSALSNSSEVPTSEISSQTSQTTTNTTSVLTSTDVISTSEPTSTSVLTSSDTSLTSQASSSSEVILTSSDPVTTSDPITTSSDTSTSTGTSTGTSTTEVPPAPETVSIIVEDANSMMEKIEAKISGVYVALDSQGTDKSGNDYYVVELGSIVKITIKDSDEYKIDSITIDDVAYTQNKNREVNFVADPDSGKTMVATIESSKLVAKTGAFALVLEKTAHLNAKFYDTTKKVEINSADSNDKVYLLPVPEDDNYGCNKITVTYIVDDMGKRSEANTYKEEGTDYFYFYCPTPHHGDVTVTLIEQNLSAFKNTGLVGKYYVLRSFSSTIGDKGFNSIYGNDPLTFDGAGNIVWGNYTATGTNYEGDEVTLLDFYSSIIASNGMLLFTPYSVTTTSGYVTTIHDAFSSTNADYCLAFKTKEETDTMDMYSFDNLITSVNEKRYLITNIFRNGELYKTYAINHTDKCYYSLANIEYYYGTKISADDSIFALYNDKTLIETFSYENEGGAANRISLTGICGCYKNNEEVLVIPNAKTAVYENVKYIVESINENTVVFYDASWKITVTLNTKNKTFTLVSKVENVIEEVNFAGHTFSGSGKNSWDSYTCSVVFDNYESEISGKLNFKSGATYIFGFTGVYDSSTFELVLTITSQNYSMGFIGNTCKLKLENDTLVTKTNFTSNGTFDWVNTVLTSTTFGK